MIVKCVDNSVYGHKLTLNETYSAVQLRNDILEVWLDGEKRLYSSKRFEIILK